MQRYFRNRFNTIHCIALPRRGSIYDNLLWREQMEKLKTLIHERVEAQVSLRLSLKCGYNRRQWCRATSKIVAKFHGVYFTPLLFDFRFSLFAFHFSLFSILAFCFSLFAFRFFVFCFVLFVC
jgi:hypothetical protein